MDEETLRTYAANATKYAALIDDDDPLLAAFLIDVAPEGRILDLGCGPGAAAARMAQAGFAVHAVDAVPEMIELARNHRGVDAQVATFSDISGTDIYAGIWANFSLLHAARGDLPTILSSLHRAVKPAGRFHIAMKLGEGSARDGIGRQYTYVTEPELRGLLAAAGFTVTGQATGRGIGLDGTYADWIALAAYG